MTPTWIWCYGDFEIRQLLLVDTRRFERGFHRPAPWQLDDCRHNVTFRRVVNLEKPETIRVRIDGVGSVTVDRRYAPDLGAVTIPAGKHTIIIEAANPTGLPAVFVEGETIVSDESWSVAYDNFTYTPAGSWNFDDPNCPPSAFALPTRPISLDKISVGGVEVYDAGCETYSAITAHFGGSGKATIYYGESLSEVLSDDPYMWQRFDAAESVSFPARAFRYIRIESDAELVSVEADYEYLPVEWRGSFTSSDEKLNKIWQVARYTLELNSREFYLDGIKRDGYVWSGDAYQSYLLGYYSNFDREIVKRTTLALGGRAPRTRHINTINDYTFYWILGLEDYYRYTGDLDFLRRVYPTAFEWIDFCISRTDENGLVVGRENDWIFVDWSRHLDKEGPICFEQMLFARSLEAISRIGALLGEDASAYAERAAKLNAQIEQLYWDEEQGAYIDSFTSGKKKVNRHANIFAIRFGFADAARAELIVRSVLDNADVPPITTPYFKFYETESLAALGRTESLLETIRGYWGGMLELGATTFWEEFDPELEGDAHYGMYGDPFGKSLCHAWGASPLYLLGRFVLGVYPTSNGYATFAVEPKPGDLESVEGTVPTPHGDVRVKIAGGSVSVLAPMPGGTLKVGGKEYPIPAGEEITVSLR